MKTNLEFPYKECVVTENNTVYRVVTSLKQNVGEIYSSGEGSLEGEFNSYKMIDLKFIENFPNFNKELNFLDFVNEKKLDSGEILVKGHIWRDPFDIETKLSFAKKSINPVFTGVYLKGPSNILDFYYTIKNKHLYRTWEKFNNLKELELPEGFKEFGYCIRVDLNKEKILLYKRYGSSFKFEKPAHMWDGNLANGDRISV